MTRVPDLIAVAGAVALMAHAQQKYGNEPYSSHLESVDSILCEFGYSDNKELRAAAWLHDVLEDTKFTPSTLLGMGIPVYVLALVDAVTNQPGRNRAERHLKTYPRISRIPDAVTLKLADRLANVRESSKNRQDLLKMYAREYFDFSLALRGKYTRDLVMWDELTATLRRYV